MLSKENLLFHAFCIRSPQEHGGRCDCQSLEREEQGAGARPFVGHTGHQAAARAAQPQAESVPSECSDAQSLIRALDRGSCFGFLYSASLFALSLEREFD